MKNLLTKSLVLICIFLLTSCSMKDEVSYSRIAYNKEYAIPVRYSVTTIDNKYTLRFDSVLEDSRCPEGLVCIWSGVAAVKFSVTEGNSAKTTVKLYTLNNSSWSDSVVYKDIKIKLLRLAPYPSLYTKYSYSAYEATIKLTKN